MSLAGMPRIEVMSWPEASVLITGILVVGMIAVAVIGRRR